MPKYNPNLIVAARKRAGLTQAETARQADRSHSTYVRYEAGVLLPSPDVLGDIADALGVPVTAFYDANDPSDPVTALDAAIKRIVAEAPPLTDEQRSRLRVLLRSAM